VSATPAPHVPCFFIKAGGSSFFSDRCIELLAKLGYEADDFGSYNHVRERLRACRAKVAAHDNPEPGVAPGEAPSARERELGAPLTSPDHYQAGHLGMNTCMQEERGNPCSNLIDGHDMGLYPCMPHQGSAMDPGSEHNRWTVREIDGPMANEGAKHGGLYPADAMSRDADERTRALLREREAAQRTSNQPAAASAPGQAGPGAAADGTSTSPVAGQAGAQDRMPPESRIDGETADECINNFRKAAEAEMKAHAAHPDTIAANQAAAGSQQARDDARAEAEAKGKEAEAAQAELAHAQRSLGGKRSAVTKAQQAAQGVPTQQQAAAIDQAQQRADEQAAEVERLRAKRDSTAAAAGAAQARSTRMENALCRANQGQAIAAGKGRTDGRYPNKWKDLPRTGEGSRTDRQTDSE